MAITVTSDRHISKNVSIPDEKGRPQRVAVMTGRVSPGSSMSVSLMVRDAVLAAEHQAEVSAAMDELWVELRTMAREAGLPV